MTKPEGRDYFPSDIADLPVSEGLNDLFQFLNPELGTDGRVVTAEDWEARRAEIADLIQYYYLGYKQPTSPENVSVRQYLRITPGYWEFTSEGFRIVPCSISSQESVNDFKPTPKEGEAAQAVVDRLLELGAKLEKTYKSTGVTAVESYPTQWLTAY